MVIFMVKRNLSNKGGYREGAGRKSSWSSGCKFEDTKLIRVPTTIAEQVLEIAHKLDSEEQIDLVSKSKNELVTDSDEQNIYSQSDLIEKAKRIIYNPELVRVKDRSTARKYFGFLLDIDKELLK